MNFDVGPVREANVLRGGRRRNYGPRHQRESSLTVARTPAYERQDQIVDRESPLRYSGNAVEGCDYYYYCLCYEYCLRKKKIKKMYERNP